MASEAHISTLVDIAIAMLTLWLFRESLQSMLLMTLQAIMLGTQVCFLHSVCSLHQSGSLLSTLIIQTLRILLYGFKWCLSPILQVIVLLCVATMHSQKTLQVSHYTWGCIRPQGPRAAAGSGT